MRLRRDDTIVTLAVLGPGARDEWSGPYPPAGSTLTGTYVLVPYAGSADVIVVATEGGLEYVEPRTGGVEARRASVVGGDAQFRIDCRDVAATSLPGDLDR